MEQWIGNIIVLRKLGSGDKTNQRIVWIQQQQQNETKNNAEENKPAEKGFRLRRLSGSRFLNYQMQIKMVGYSSIYMLPLGGSLFSFDISIPK